MNEEVVVEKKRKSPPRGARGANFARRFTEAEKLKAVRLHLEEGFTIALVCQELGVSKGSLVLWLRAYREKGEAGLKCPYAGPRTPKLPAPITEKIIELKQQNPSFGIKRISQILRRCFFLPASPETVRQRLHDAELMTQGSPPRKRNLTRPRFFERATPNQMWQTDIFKFRLGGRYAHHIAFMDDYSRFIVAADLNAIVEACSFQ
jgi:transposase